MSRAVEIKRRNLFRNIAISIGLILIAILAKMEAINFLIAMAVAVFVLEKTYRPILSAFDIPDEIISEKLYPFSPSVAGKLIWGMFSWRLPGILWLTIGVGSGYLTYLLLNKLFISP